MLPPRSYFRPPDYAHVSSSPEKNHPSTTSCSTPTTTSIREPDDSCVSSPLSDPPPSSNVSSLQGPSTPIPDTPDGPGAQLNASLSKSLHDLDHTPRPSVREESFQSTLSSAPPSTLGSSSQRIIKAGKEVVISSDGEDTDTLSDLDDPSTLFASTAKPESKNAPATTKWTRPSKSYLASLTAQKKYKNNIDDLVQGAVDYDEVEAKVAKVKATFVQSTDKPGPKRARDSSTINESILTSALGDAEEEDGPELHRLLNAVRRTEALDQDRHWTFFDQPPASPDELEFPIDNFSPTSHLAALRKPDSRVRMIQSGILEFATSLGRLPDEIILWIFQSIPIEPREELRKAYCRIIVNTPSKSIQSLIHSSDIDCLFRQLGAKPHALDLSSAVVEDSTDHLASDHRFKDRGKLLSIFSLLQDASELFSVDVRSHAIHILLRISLDISLTQDHTIRSKLQSALTALLENVSEDEIDDIEHRIGTTLYNIVKDPQFQNCMIQHILPTSPWISLLRYRLCVSFLLQEPTPLTEPVEKVLDLERLTSIIRDPRFQINVGNGNETECDYGNLIALTQLLEVALNSALYDIGDGQAGTEKELNCAVDKLAAQLKTNFSSLKESGASHLKRMLAKGALETLHYRLVYSVRSKPPPKKTPFQTFAKEGNSINSYFNKAIGDDATNGDARQIPIRGPDHAK